MINRPTSQIEQMKPDDLRDHGLPKDDLTCYYLNERTTHGRNSRPLHRKDAVRKS